MDTAAELVCDCFVGAYVSHLMCMSKDDNRQMFGIDLHNFALEFTLQKKTLHSLVR